MRVEKLDNFYYIFFLFFRYTFLLLLNKQKIFLLFRGLYSDMVLSPVNPLLSYEFKYSLIFLLILHKYIIIIINFSSNKINMDIIINLSFKIFLHSVSKIIYLLWYTSLSFHFEINKQNLLSWLLIRFYNFLFNYIDVYKSIRFIKLLDIMIIFLHTTFLIFIKILISSTLSVG